MLRELEKQPEPFGSVELHCIYTPFDLMIVPPTSSILPAALSVHRVLVGLHRLMVRDRRVLDLVASAYEALTTLLTNTPGNNESFEVLLKCAVPPDENGLGDPHSWVEGRARMLHQDEDLDSTQEETTHIEHTYLTFTLGDEGYAVPVRYVTEIVRLQKTYVIPDVPEYIRGVINLRGKVIPLLDVRRRFKMNNCGYTDRTVVVVIEYNDAPTGLVVDAVSEVLEITADKIEPPRAGGEARSSMVSGVALREETVLFILDVARLLEGTPLPASELPGQAATSTARGA